MADDIRTFQTEKMRIWLLKDGENMPIQAGSRKMRMGMLADVLTKRGHKVTWWASTFSHQRKTLLYNSDAEIDIKPGYCLKLLHAGGYKQNISFRRYFHHSALSTKFAKSAKKQQAPHVLVSAYPIIDLAWEAVRYGKPNGVKTIVDIRDLWPDIFIDKTPQPLKKIVRYFLCGFFTKASWTLNQADSLVAVSQGYLNWGLKTGKRNQRASDRVFYIGYPDIQKNKIKRSEKVENLKEKIKNKVVFTFIGSFGYSYELDLICKAAELLARNGNQMVYFILAGDGHQFDYVQKQAEFFLNLSLTGWLDRNELYQVLQVSDVGLVPCLSHVDTVPNKPFEYLSAGLPIISSLKGEMSRIISKYQIGYSYSCGDVQKFNRLVINLSENGLERKRMSENACKLFNNFFREEVIYNEYAAHVENIAGGTY